MVRVLVCVLWIWLNRRLLCVVVIVCGLICLIFRCDCFMRSVVMFVLVSCLIIWLGIVVFF